MGIKEIHLKNIENVVKALSDEVQEVWGINSAYVHDIKVDSIEETEVGEYVRSTVWIKASVLTGDYQTGLHLTKTEVTHSREVTVEEYVGTLYKVLSKNCRDYGTFYVYEDGKVQETIDYVGRSVITFSAIAFDYHMSVQEELDNTLKGLPVINDNFMVKNVEYIKEKIGTNEGYELRDIYINKDGFNLLTVEEEGDIYIFGMTYVFALTTGGKMRRFVLPFVTKKNGVVREENYLRVREGIKESVNV